MKDKFFIGIDGGATKTVGVLFDINGKTLGSYYEKGSNLAINQRIHQEELLI